MNGERSKPRRGMLAFYIGTGVVLALFLGGWFARAPLKIWYWEVRLRPLVAQDRKEIPLTDFARGNDYMAKVAHRLPRGSPVPGCGIRRSGGARVHVLLWEACRSLVSHEPSRAPVAGTGLADVE